MRLRLGITSPGRRRQLDQGAVAGREAAWKPHHGMGRSRSPLENAVYAFIALSLFARLAGVLFTASTAGGHGASALAVWAGVSSALAYVLIGVELLVLILLVATGRYVLAAGVALLMGFGFIYEAIDRGPGAIAGHRPSAPAAAIGPRSGPAFDAA